MKFLGMNIVRGGDILERMASYTEVIQQAWSKAIRNSQNNDATATAVVEFGLGQISRAFMVAEPNVLPGILSPVYLAAAARDLIATGNHVAEIDVVGTEITLERASAYEIRGGHTPRSWRYTLDFNAPNSPAVRHRNVLSSNVVHIRLNPDKGRPWEGRSPLIQAGLSAELIAHIEAKLDDEMNAPVANIVQHPDGTITSGEQTTALGGSIAGAKGGALIQKGGTSGGWRQGGTGKWANLHLGPEPKPAGINLRSDVSRDILSAMGIPAGLYATSDREAYRQLLAATVGPYAALIEHELTTKLNQQIRLSFHRLGAADVAARSRAFKGLVEGGLTRESAARVCDLGDVEFEERTEPAQTPNQQNDDATE